MDSQDYSLVRWSIPLSYCGSNSEKTDSDGSGHSQTLTSKEQNSMASTSTERLPCYICEKSFKSQMLLNRHIRTHDDTRPFGCDQCDKKFKTKTHLKEHKRSHSGERPFQCKECEATFKTHSQLRLHRFVHINASRASTSSSLPKVNNVGDQLSSSESEEEVEVKKNSRFPCKVEGCGKAFRFATNLTNHMIVHQEERPFKCDQCEKTFKSKASLMGHKITHQEATFVCPKCDKKFITEEHLKRHEDVHTDEPPFLCYRCKQVCESESVLRRHMQMHQMRDAKKALKKKRIRRPRRVSEPSKEPETSKEQETSKEPEQKRIKTDPEEVRLVVATTVPEDLVSEPTEPQPSTSYSSIEQMELQTSVDVETKPIQQVILQDINQEMAHSLIMEREKQSQSTEAGHPTQQVSLEAMNQQITQPSTSQPMISGYNNQSTVNIATQYIQQIPNTSQQVAHPTIIQQENQPQVNGGAHNLQQTPLQTVNHQMKATQWQQYCNMMWSQQNIPYANYYYNPYPFYNPYQPNGLAGVPVHPNMVPSSSTTTKEPQVETQAFDDELMDDVKRFLCDVCDKRFKSSTGLRQHFLIHTKEKKHKCSYYGCRKAFTQKCQLDQHLRIHSGDRPYICDYCDKDFIQMSHLIVHERLHTGETPYPCNFCDRAFRQLSAKNLHEMKMHVKEILPPTPSPADFPPVAPGTPLIGRRLATLKLKPEPEPTPKNEVLDETGAPCSSTMATDAPGPSTSISDNLPVSSSPSDREPIPQETEEVKQDNVDPTTSGTNIQESKDSTETMSYSLRSKAVRNKPIDEPCTSRGCEYFAQLGILIEECKKFYGKFNIPLKNIRFPGNYSVKCEAVLRRRASQLVSTGRIWEATTLDKLVGIVAADDIEDIPKKAPVLLLENHGLISALRVIKEDKRLLDASPAWLQASNPVVGIEIVAVPGNIFDACSQSLSTAGKYEIRASMTVVLYQENEASDQLTLKTLRSVVDASERHTAIAADCWNSYLEGQPASTIGLKRWRYIFLAVCAPEPLYNEIVTMAKRNSKRDPNHEDSGRFLVTAVLKPLMELIRIYKKDMTRVISGLEQLNGYKDAQPPKEISLWLEMILSNPDDVVPPKVPVRRCHAAPDAEYIPPAEAQPSRNKRKSDGSRACSSEKVPIEESNVAVLKRSPRTNKVSHDKTPPPTGNIGNGSPANTDSTGVSIIEENKSKDELIITEMNADKSLPLLPSDLEELPTPPTISPLPVDRDFSHLEERNHPPAPENDDIYIVEVAVNKTAVSETKVLPMTVSAVPITLDDTIEIDDDDDDITVIDSGASAKSNPVCNAKPSTSVDRNKLMSSPSESIISDLTSVSRVVPNITNTLQINRNLAGSSVVGVRSSEVTGVPLSTAIFLRAQSYTDEMMLIWVQGLEVDVLTAAQTYPHKCLVAVEHINSNTDNYQIRDMLTRPSVCSIQVHLKSVVGREAHAIPWTIISFDNSLSKEKDRNLLNSYTEIERIAVDAAQAKNMKLVHVVRWAKEGLFTTLSQRLRRSVIGCNHVLEPLQ